MTQHTPIAAPRRPAPDPVSLDRIEAALVCCAQARDAARRGRLEAAQGLLQTALAMHGQTEGTFCDASDTLFTSRFDNLINDLCYSAQVIEVEQVARQVLGSRTMAGDA